jgi:iron only hydrogenase large subunit-like protein
MKKAVADKKKGDGPKKGVNPFAKKDESVKTSKKVVAESFEPKLTFREMMKLVVESGGQQQIDAVDQELFAWAQRIAKQKLGEGMKAEVYAGMVYERMGGVFEMYDVLAEDQN